MVDPLTLAGERISDAVNGLDFTDPDDDAALEQLIVLTEAVAEGLSASLGNNEGGEGQFECIDIGDIDELYDYLPEYIGEEGTELTSAVLATGSFDGRRLDILVRVDVLISEEPDVEGEVTEEV